jgi:hypothetical protein
MNLRTLSAFVIGLAAAGAVSAQSVTLQAKIPFSFAVNGKILPAGEYHLYQGGSPGTMIIKGIDHKVGAFAVVFSTAARSTQQDSARLVFNGYGDRYFLTQIWTGDGQGSQLPMTGPERELIAHKNSPSERVVAVVR